MTELREFILSLKSPVVFQGRISEWEMLKWSEKEWSSLFGNKALPFRCGPKKCTALPQWERTCKTLHMTLDESFTKERLPSQDWWHYFDYKYVNQWIENSNAFKTLSWSNFGFPDITQDDCTLWIGSAGSHTPCHKDTYGCNLVAQLYGHKQWILFPPSEGSNLKMTRVPYEESSVYSSLNFNTPIDSTLCNAHIVTLSPGDVLFVPHHWWHYVENLDMAIAINTWIPLESDDKSRMSEVLVRLIVSQLISNMPPEEVPSILNPNEDDLPNASLLSTLSQMDLCIERCSVRSTQSRSLEESACEIDPLVEICGARKSECEDDNKLSIKRRKVELLGSGDDSHSNFPLNGIKDFRVLSSCTPDELKCVLDKKCKCSSPEEHKIAVTHNPICNDAMKLLPGVINAFCHPDVIDTVSKHLLTYVGSEKL